MSQLRTCILSQGSEILSGSILNGNAHWLSEFFDNTQYTIVEHCTIGDSLDDLLRTFDRLCSQYDVIISSGGLGPTEDDLTTEVLSKLSNNPLTLHPDAMEMLEKYYHTRNRVMPPPVRKQAYIPETATLISNPIGSACGFHLTHNDTEIYVFPGVPAEMKAMVTQCFERTYPHPPLVFGTFGASESRIVHLLEGLDLPPIAFHATRRAHWLSLFPDPSTRDALQHSISSRLSEVLFDCGDRKSSLLDVVANHLWNRQEMVATAESCTAGKLSSWFTSIPGSSGYYQEGVIVYSNEAKHKYCGVSMELIQEQGAVCQQVAMGFGPWDSRTFWGCVGNRNHRHCRSRGGSIEKPVGTVHIAVYGHGQHSHTHCSFHGTRDQITDQACGQAMFMLLRLIETNPI